jgi:CRISPR/Cas system-associated exonuclease Cas4 (RecB family)
LKVGIEERFKDINNIIQILNSYAGKNVQLDDVLLQLATENITSSDLLFLILQKLNRDGYVNGSKGVITVLGTIDKGEINHVNEEIKSEISRKEKLFVTPLEVGKFYQCPRRLWLEKVVLSREFKEERGKTWDGEVLHLAVNLLIKNMGIKTLDELVKDVVREVMVKYSGRVEITKDKIRDFISKFYDLINEEKFSKIFTEKTFESFKMGLVGTPDIVALKEVGELVPIDIKLGKLSEKGVKEEHLLQNIGEAILVEEFFRKRVYYSYLIYFESNSLVKINISEGMKREFLVYKRGVERMAKGRFIPEMSKLPNSKIRVCRGCHAKPACDNIETLKRIW